MFDCYIREYKSNFSLQSNFSPTLKTLLHLVLLQKSASIEFPAMINSMYKNLREFLKPMETPYPLLTVGWHTVACKPNLYVYALMMDPK